MLNPSQANNNICHMLTGIIKIFGSTVVLIGELLKKE